VSSFADLILFYGFFLGITLAIGNLALKREKKSSDYYTFSIFLMGLLLLNMALYSTGIIRNYEYICTALLPLTYLAAASQYVRYNTLVTETEKEGISRYLSYLPAAAVFIIVLIPAFHPELEYKKELLRFEPVFNGNYLSLPLYYKILMLLYPGLYFFHLALFSIPLTGTFFIWSRRNADQNLQLSKAAYLCALFICLASVIGAMGCLYSLTLVKAGTFIGDKSMLLTFILAMRYPEFRIRLHEEIKKFSYLKSKIRTLNVHEITDQLNAIMEQGRAYAVEGITIRDVAAELEISVHQLSEILNRYMGKNFNSYINSFRIDEAKKLLLERPELTVIQISGEVGFSSSSIFSTAFSKSEGISPRDYRKKTRKEGE